MDEEEARRIAWRILGEIEETMGEEGVAVHSGDSNHRVKVRAFFEDREYEMLENTIVRILLEANKVQAVVHAESLDGHDW